MGIYHITARLNPRVTTGGMYITGTVVAVNAAGTFKVYPPVDPISSGSVEVAGTYAFALPPYGPDDGAAPTITDSAGAQTINALIAGTGGNDIVVPGSTTYICTSAIAIPSGKTLRAATGTSVTLLRHSAYAGSIVTMIGCNNSAIKNITLDGNWTKRSAIEGGASYGIEIQNGSGNTIEHCLLTMHPSYGIWEYNSNRMNVLYNEFTEVWQPIRIDGNNLTGTAATIWGNNFLNTSAFKSIQGVEAINWRDLNIWHNTMAGFGLQEPTSHGFEGTWGNCLYLWKGIGLHVENNTLNQAYWSALVVGQSAQQAVVLHNDLTYGTQSGSAGTGGTRSFWFEQTGADDLEFHWNYLVGGLLCGDNGGNNINMSSNDINVYDSDGLDISFACTTGIVEHNTITRISGSDNGMLLWEKAPQPIDFRVLGNTFVNWPVGIWITRAGNTGTVFGLTILSNTFINCPVEIDWPAGISIDSSCNIQGFTINESPHNTTIPSATQIIDALGAVWTVVDGVIYRNGVATISANVTLLLYWNSVVYQQNSAGNWWFWNNDVTEGNPWTATNDPRVAAPPMPSIQTARHPRDFLQVGNVGTDTYFIHDNRWGQGSIVEGSGTGQFMQQVERQLSVGSLGQIAFRTQWRWPISIGGALVDGNPSYNEVKAYPSAVYGAHPGYRSDSTKYPADEKAVRLPDGVNITTMPADAPGHWSASDWAISGGSQSTTVPSGSTPGTDLPKQLPLSSGSLIASGRYSISTGASARGQLTFDIWLQDPAVPQQTHGTFSAPITHEIMIPLRNFGNYGIHSSGRNPTWRHTAGDVVINGVQYRMYCAKSSDGALRYDFGGLNGAYSNEESTGGRTGWKFIVFQHEGTAHPLLSDGSFSLDLSQFINHCHTLTDSRAIAFTQGTEQLVSVELGIEPIIGAGDLTVWDYRVQVPA